MMIFNQGKYRNLYAAKENELTTLASQVQCDHHHRPQYHLAPPTGLLNDPNGLVFDGENYHIFYQWYPFGALHGMKHWQHYCSKDFIHFQQAELLIPDQLFESHGCYSGGAILYQDQIVAFYTGNTRRQSDNQRIPFQNMAIFTKQGKLLEKRVLLHEPPVGYTEHCRDPKPFLTDEGKIRFILGAQRQDLSGTALLFEMDNLNDTPKLLGELALHPFDNKDIFMWECPDLSKLKDKDLFIWSPQGKQQQQTQFQNNYHATYALGKLQHLNFQVETFSELDQGFDFYAPQTFSGLNDDSKILLAWCGLPDLQYPTDQYQWHSMLTLPRQLWLQNNQIYQRPVEQIYQQIGAMHYHQQQGKIEIPYLSQSYLKLEVNNQAFDLQLFKNELNQHLEISYHNGIFCLNRAQSEQSESMQKWDSKRYCEINDLQKIEIFIDHSIIEIFLNDGEKAMTSRFFIEKKQPLLWISPLIKIASAEVSPIHFD